MLDLVVLTADCQQETTIRTLLTERTKALRIRPVTFEVLRHPHKDPGVWKEADAFLAAFRARAAHALVVIDQHWAGSPDNAQITRQDLLGRLQTSGWAEGTYEVVVVAPELEAWVWASSPVVTDVLRCDLDEIRKIADLHSWWPIGAAKPLAPKELLEAVLRQQRRPRSASIFAELAQRVSLERCSDPSFLLFRETLRRWFRE